MERSTPNPRIDTDAQTAAFIRCLGAGHAQRSAACGVARIASAPGMQSAQSDSCIAGVRLASNSRIHLPLKRRRAAE
jgi:hypothetical protein